MRKLPIVLLIAAILMLAGSIHSALAINQSLSFSLEYRQNSNLYSGSQDITYSTYYVSSGGSPITTETHSTSFSSGRGTVILENISAIDWRNDVYVEVQVTGYSAMTPRIQLYSAADSMNNPFKTNGAVIQQKNSSATFLGNLQVVGGITVNGTPVAAHTFDTVYFYTDISNIVYLNESKLNRTIDARVDLLADMCLSNEYSYWNGSAFRCRTDNSGGGSGTVTQVDTGSFMTGGPITVTGTISLNSSGLVANIGNWSADKSSYSTTSQGDARWLQQSGGTVNGNLVLNGNLTVIGSTITANVTNVNINGSFDPALTGTFNIGSNTAKWNNVTANNLNGNWNGSSEYTKTSIADTRYILNASIPTCSGSDKLTSSGNGVITCASDNAGNGTVEGLTNIASPNGSINVVTNATHANLTVNITWLDGVAILQGEYPNLDTDGTNDLTTATSWGGDLSGTGTSPEVRPNSTTLDWNNVTGKPAGFADNVDDDTTYTGGNGITITGTQINLSIGFGVNGTNGANGLNGTGINNIYILSNGSLQINLTNGTNITTGNLTGAAGATGSQGNAGSNGLNGTGILTIYVLSNGSLQINLTNGTNITSGNLTGAQGIQGIQGIQGDAGAAGTNATANWTIANSVNSTVVGQAVVVNFTNGAGISITQVGTNPINLTITNTGDTNAADDLTTGTSWSGDLSGTGSSPEVRDNSHNLDWANITNKPTVGTGTSNFTTIVSPNGSIIVSQNSTHANITANLTYFDANFVGQTEYANLDTDATNDLTLAQVVANAGNWSSDRANYVNTTVGDTRYVRNASIPTCSGTDKLTSAGNGVITCATDTDTDTNSGYTQWRLGNETGSIAITNNTMINLTAGGAITISRTGTNPVNISIAHSDTSTQANSDNSGRTYIQDITVDTYGHITGLVTATETVVDTDTNSGGTSNISTFLSPNGSIIYTYNATHVNATINGTWLDSQVVMQSEYPNLDTDSTNDATLAGVASNMGNWSSDRPNYVNTTVGDTRYVRNASIPTCTGNDKLTSAGNGVFTCTSDVDTNNGGTSNVTNFASPNGSIILTANSTHVNATVNGSWLDTQVVMQGEYPNLDTDSTNDLTLAQVNTNMGNFSGNASTWSTCNAGEVSKWNGAAFTCVTDTSGSGSSYNQSLNTTDGVTFAYLNLTSANPEIGLNDSPSNKRWKISVGNSGTEFSIISPDGATIIKAFNANAGATIQNVVAQSSYAGAQSLNVKSTSGQTENIIVVENSTGSDFVVVNATGYVNITTGLIINNKQVCLADGTNCQAAVGDGNSGGTSNVSIFGSPNGSIVFTYNTTHVNATINGTWLDTQVVTQTEYANLDTDSTNDLTLAQVNTNMGNWSADRSAYVNTTIGDTRYIRNASIPTCGGTDKLTSAGNGVITCGSDVDTDTNSGFTQLRFGIGTGNVSAATNNTLINISAGAGIALTQVGTGPINITITNTGDTDASNDLTTASAWSGGDLTGTGLAATVGTGAVASLEIVDGAIVGIDIMDSSINSTKLNITNAGTNGQVLTKAANGQFTWADDQTGGAGGNPFNQSLNTSDSVKFNNVNVTTNLTLGGYINLEAGGGIIGSGGIILSGGGTTGYIPIWSNATNVSNSIINQSTGTSDKFLDGGNTVNINGNLMVTGSIRESGGLELVTTTTYGCPFMVTQATTMCYPNFIGSAISSGTLANVAGSPTHPGSISFLGTTAANSGYRFTTDVTAFLLNGSEEFRFSANFSADTFTNRTKTRIGFIDSITTAAVADGVYFEIWTNATGVYASGVTANNSAYNYTANFSLTPNQWYNYDLRINNDASNVTFYIYDDSRTLIWNATTVATGVARIPVTAGRQTGAGFTALRLTAGTARVIGQIDYMVAEIRSPRRPYG